MGTIGRSAGWLHSHTIIADGALAIAVLLLSLAMNAQSNGLLFSYSSFLWMSLWSGAVILPAIWRRRSPDQAAVAFIVIAILQLILGPSLTLTDSLSLVMLYSVIVYGSPRHTRRFILTAFIMGFLAIVVTSWTNIAGSAWPVLTDPDVAAVQQCPTAWSMSIDAGCARTLGLNLLWGYGVIAVCLLSAVTLAYWQRARLQTARMIAERNDALAASEEESSRNAASAERARIARDMHDVVAHTLSIIIVQADGGRYAGVHDPALARESMENIRHESRRALHDMTILLGVFGGSHDCDYTHVADVIEQARQASAGSLTIGRIVEGTPATERLDPTASTAMYRVVQEALTNVRKYAGPDVRVTIRETWTDDGLRVDIIDDGRGTSSSRDGHKPGYGLMGMRERIEAVHGTVDAGPRNQGGFEVQASVPYSAAMPLTHHDGPGASDGGHSSADGTSMTPLRSPLNRAHSLLTRLTRGAIDAKRNVMALDDPHGISERDSTARSDSVPRPDGTTDDPRGRIRANGVERLSRWTQRHYWFMDMLGTLAAIVLIGFLPPSGYVLMGSGYAMDFASTQGDGADSLMVTTLLLPLCVRRRFPETSAAIIATVCALQLIVFPHVLFFNIIALLSLYSANLYGRDKAWRWTSVAAIINAVLFAVKATAGSMGYSTIIDLIILNRNTTTTSLSLTGVMASLITSFVTVMMACLATIAMARWSRSSGTNALVLSARQEALEIERREQRILAANIERERIGSSIRSQIREALTGVIDEADHGIDLLDEARRAHTDPDPQLIERSFSAIGERGRKALSQMRKLLGVLRDTGGASTQGRTETGPRLSPAAPLDDQLRKES